MPRMEEAAAAGAEVTDAQSDGASQQQQEQRLGRLEMKASPSEVFQRVARQLEYYFSVQNLSRDTYLRTLRELNDGFVPASILANFAKVQSILYPSASTTETVEEAVKDYSDILVVVHVDKDTSKVVEDPSDSAGRTLLCVGPPKGAPPIEMTPNSSRKLATAASSLISPAIIPSPSSNKGVHSIILRDVPGGVSEEEVRTLFKDFGSKIQSISQDVSNTWFVGLNSNYEEVMAILMDLRSKTLGGQSVKGRLKSTSSIPTAAILPPIYDPSLHSEGQSQSTPFQFSKHHTQIHGAKFTPYPNTQQPRNGHKQSFGKKTNHAGNHNEQQSSKTSSYNKKSQSRRKQAKNGSSRDLSENSSLPSDSAIRTQPRLPPPTLTEEAHFPLLKTSVKKKQHVKGKGARVGSPKSIVVESKEVNMNLVTAVGPSVESEKDKPQSDTASTATTSTTSSSVVAGVLDQQQQQQQTTISAPPMGYAAALLKTSSKVKASSMSVASPDATEAQSQPLREVQEREKVMSSKDETPRKKGVATLSSQDPTQQDEFPSQTSTAKKITKASWGNGASFADVLKTNTSLTAASAKSSSSS